MSISISDRYIVGNIISKGSFGTVYEATRKLDNYKVAIKIINSNIDVEVFKKEVNFLKSIDYPFIVHLIEYANQNDQLWIVMEYCRCGSIANYIRKGNRLDEAAIRDMLACCLVGLVYLHNNKIIHRDIKPDNLFLSEQGVIKLGDFGLSAQLNSSVSLRTTICGTYIYMAPEVFDSQTCLKSDIWSLGISAIELAEGKHPYANLDYVTIIKHIVMDNSPKLTSSSWSSDFVDFVNQCLIKDVTKRPSAAELMKHPFIVDAIERIGSRGKSEILTRIAESQLDQMDNTNSEINSCNIVPLTILNLSKEESLTTKLVTITHDDTFLCMEKTIENLVIVSNVCNSDSITTWAISSLTQLQSLHIASLNKIEIGDNCFTQCSEEPTESKNNCLSIANCQSLDQITIGSLAFAEWNQFTLRNCSSLTHVDIKNNCFVYSSHILYENLPTLQSITIRSNSFKGNQNMNNVLIMKNLTTLNEIQCGLYSFRYIREVELENIPQLVFVQFALAFEDVKIAHVINSSELENNGKLQEAIQRTQREDEKRIEDESKSRREEVKPREEKVEITREEVKTREEIETTKEEVKTREKIETTKEEVKTREEKGETTKREEIETTKREEKGETTNKEIETTKEKIETTTNKEVETTTRKEEVKTNKEAETTRNTEEIHIEKDVELQKKEQNNQERKERGMQGIIAEKEDLSYVPTTIINLTIMNSSCNDLESDTFDLSQYKQLQHLTIGDNCFNRINKTIINDLPALTSIKIGSNCFNTDSNDGYLKIQNCPKLEYILIGCQSCQWHRSLELTILGQIEQPSNCFQVANLVLRDLPQLQSITLGNKCFESSLHTLFKNLPQLKSIQLGDGALRDLPLLSQIQATNGCFINSKVILNNVPQLNIDILPESMQRHIKQNKKKTCTKSTKVWLWIVFGIVMFVLGSLFIIFLVIFFQARNGYVKSTLHWKLLSDLVDVDFSEFNNVQVINIVNNLNYLETITIGDNSLKNNLPKLEYIHLGLNTLKGNEEDDDSSLTLQGLPSLTNISSKGNSFVYPRSITFENIPNVNHVDLPQAFQKVKSCIINSNNNKTDL